MGTGHPAAEPTGVAVPLGGQLPAACKRDARLECRPWPTRGRNFRHARRAYLSRDTSATTAMMAAEANGSTPPEKPRNSSTTSTAK
jgi:hypothetical protein